GVAAGRILQVDQRVVAGPRSKRPAFASARKAANACRPTTCAPASGRLLSRTATTSSRLATSTHPPLCWLRRAFRQVAWDRSVIGGTPAVVRVVLGKGLCHLVQGGHRQLGRRTGYTWPHAPWLSPPGCRCRFLCRRCTARPFPENRRC